MEAIDWIWIITVALFGLAVGSFLNVVMYRLPRGMSVSNPKRSFCPHCKTSIAARDNIPVVSFLLLGGTCRHCDTPISVRYPIVEMLTALVFVLVVDTFVVAQAREGVGDEGVGSVLSDWPVIIAHLILVASLLVISAIDIEEYMVDLRITWLLIGVGCVVHVLWTPTTSKAWWQPWPATAGATLAAAVGLIAARLLWPVGESPEPEDQANGSPSRQPTVQKHPPAHAGRTLGVWMLVAVLAAGLALMAIDAAMPTTGNSFPLRAGLILLACFGGIVGASAVHRESDDEIAVALEEERPMARRGAIAELLYLTPAIVLGAGALLLLRVPAVGQSWAGILNWRPVGDHQPVFGLATAVSGMIIAGSIGWGVRIVFTLILGKEAFGLGDVHIMAAAGAVAGWEVVVIGFFLGAVLALAGVLCLLAVKRTRAIPFGPWLSLGIVLAMVAYQPIHDWFEPGLKGLMFMMNLVETG